MSGEPQATDPGPSISSEILQQVLALAGNVARLHALVDQTARANAELLADQKRLSKTIYNPNDGLVVQIREIKTVGRWAARIGWALVTSSGGSLALMGAVAYKAYAALEAFRVAAAAAGGGG